LQATKTAKRPNGALLGRRQFAKAICPCIKKRKASQCDCQLCTYVEDNLRRWHKARHGWHGAKRERIGGQPCNCHIHSALLQPALEAEEAIWLAAGAAAAEPQEAHADQWAAAAAARARAEQYDSMTASPTKLAAALLPCGQQSYPDYSVTGTLYREYSQPCAASNCPKQVFAPRETCGWQHVFGTDCPIESSGEAFEWFVWQMQQRGTDADGKPTYSPEWMPYSGTRAEFFKEFRDKVRDWLYHSWRDRVLRHSLRIFDDRRSGRHVVALRARVTGPLLLADALRVVAEYAELEQLRAIALAPANIERRRAAIAGTLAAVARVAEAAATSHRPSDQAVAALSRAEAQFASLAGTAFIQVDYAAQFESERARTATCARMERHNFEVCHAGFSPYVQAAREGRFRNKRPRERFVYKQQVYVFFAFSNAGYKPNARSHNIVQEDIAHFLKYGTFLHGEWFEGGERYPGGPTGDARQPLPGALSEAAPAPPVLPGMDRQVEVSDGCGSQYDSGTQHHQTAEWRTKTANWPEAREAATAAAAEMAAATTEAERAAAAARKAAAEGGIVKVHVKKVESHGKAGATDGNGNVPTFALKSAIESGALLHPGTRDLVLFLADHRRAPSVAQEAKDGWGAATKYFWGYMDTAKFSKRAVPDCEARGWSCHDQHVYVGLCADRQRAERDGPLRTGRMFCACVPCSMLDFEHCEMTAMVGRTRPVNVPLPRGTASRVSQIESLEEWASLLKLGMVVAVRAAAAERHLEGGFWLLHVDSEAFEVPEDLVHSTSEYEAGWLVVRARWFALHQRSPRGYRLRTEERLIVVNTMIRLPNVIFSGGAVGKPPRESRSGLHILEEDMYNLLSESV
jgi:hypothetical protein|tara:strand:- start:632 stop:3205 length:2574 start_codon:yes stop_codon:yes gene_type:complete